MKLDITRRTRLAVLVMLALERTGTRTKGSELADMVLSTTAFVPQVVAPLVQKGWVRSDPGPTGGYSLVVDLETISLLDLIEATEGPTDLGLCVLDGGRCDGLDRCAIHDALTNARSRLLDELANLTLRDVERNPRDTPR